MNLLNLKETIENSEPKTIALRNENNKLVIVTLLNGTKLNIRNFEAWLKIGTLYYAENELIKSETGYNISELQPHMNYDNCRCLFTDLDQNYHFLLRR